MPAELDVSSRTLSLKREALADLSTGELSSVGGAAPLPSGITCPLLECTEGLPTWYCYLSVPC
ncbi:MAG TPA: hypothetical protein VF519_10425 [Mycobacteriales bacterium]